MYYKAPTSGPSKFHPYEKRLFAENRRTSFSSMFAIESAASRNRDGKLRSCILQLAFGQRGSNERLSNTRLAQLAHNVSIPAHMMGVKKANRLESCCSCRLQLNRNNNNNNNSDRLACTRTTTLGSRYASPLNRLPSSISRQTTAASCATRPIRGNEPGHNH